MKLKKSRLFCLLAAASSVSYVHAATINKAGTGTDITDPASWGGTAPGANDTATWIAASNAGAFTLGPAGATSVDYDAIAFGGNIGGASGPISIGSLTDTGTITFSSTTTSLLNNSTNAVTINDAIICTGTASVVTAPGVPGTRALHFNVGGSGSLTVTNSVSSLGTAAANDGSLHIRGSGSGLGTISGNLNIDGPLTKTDTSTWVLSGTNTVAYTVIQNGTLLIGNNSALGSGTVYLNNTGSVSTMSFGSALAANSTSTLANNFVISGAANTFNLGSGTGNLNLNGTISQNAVVGTVTKSGATTVTLNGANTYTGATTVNGGTLNVPGSLTSALTVNTGATLMGTGSTSGALTLTNGSTIFGASGTASGTNGTSFTAASITTSAGGIKVVGPAAADGTVDIARYTGTWTGTSTDFDLSAFRSASAVTSVPGTTGNKLQFTVTKLADTWTQASGTWNNTHAAGLWSNSTDNAYYSGDDVLFSDISGQPSATVTLGTVVTPSSITFNNTSATSYTLGGTSGIGGDTGLALGGAGTVTLANTNTFTGQTNLAAGTLILSHARALQNSTLNGTGGTLVFDSSVTSNSFTLGAITGSQAIALQNNAGSPAAIALSVGGNNASTTYTGSLSGAGSLIKIGAGTLTLTGNLSGLSGTYSNQGGVTVMNSTSGPIGTASITGGEIQLTSTANSLGAAPSVTLAGGILRFDNATATNYSLNNLTAGSNIFINNGSTLRLTTGTLNFGTTASVIQSTGTTGKLTSGAVSGILTVTSNTGLIDHQIKVQIANNGATTVSLLKNGAGQVTLQNANAYTGSSTISNGIVVANNSAAFSTGVVTIGNNASNAAQLFLGNGVNIANALNFGTNGGLQGQAMLHLRNTDSATLSGPITLTGSTTSGGQFLTDPGATLNITSAITSASAVVIQRNGNLVLSGGGSYASYFLAGSLKLGANNGVATNASVTVGQSGNGTLDLNGFNQTLAGVTKGGSAAVITNTGATASTLTLNGSGGTYGGTIVNGTGGISLVLSGSGTTTLTGANTYTGNTTINSGTLSLSTAYLADASNVIMASGTALNLNYTGTDTVNQLIIGGVPQAVGLYKSSTGVGAGTVLASLTGDGKLQVTTGGVTDYASWAASKAFTVGVNDGKANNPDNDGLNNLGEFAFDGNPLSGKNDGKIVHKIAVINGESMLTLTLPVLTEAAFVGGGPLVSSPINGISYQIECGETLEAFDQPVMEVTDPADLATIQGTLAVDHPLTPGWSYRTFSVGGSVTNLSKQFIRARVTE